MWIAKKELKDLLNYVEDLHGQAANSGDEAIMAGSSLVSNDCFRDLLWSHMELRQKLASLTGKLLAIIMRSWI